MSNLPLIYAVVLAWNQWAETRACLESLSKSERVNLRIVLVDNGSTDGTTEQVAQNFPAIEVLRTEANVGIARGYNMGMEYALRQNADFVMILNNDTEMAPNMTFELMAALGSHPAAGMVMPKIYHFFGKPNRLWCAGIEWRPFPPRAKYIGWDAPDGPPFDQVFPIEYAPSCCMLMKSGALKTVGLFDPSYYFYFSDLELSARFWQAGFEILFVPTARMWHKVSMSTQKSVKPQKWWFDMGQSSVLFISRYRPRRELVVHTIWWLMRETIKLKFNRLFPFLFGVMDGLAQRWGWKN